LASIESEVAKAYNSLMGLFNNAKPDYKLFDLTTRDLSEIEIKKSASNHCYITDGKDNYSGFILCNKTDTQTICEVVFFPSSKSGLYIPRLTFSKIKVSTGEEKDSQSPTKVRIAFDGSEEGVDEFWKMIGFLSSFKELVDLGEFTGNYKVVGIDDVVLHLKDLEEAERIKEIVSYAQKSGVEIEDLVGTALQTKRRETLARFRKLLDDPAYVAKYREHYKAEIKGAGDEAVWHHFLKANDWLLGINLDIRFIDDFTDEVSVGNPDTANRDNPKADLMGLADYTVLVELKTPNTDIFTPVKTSDARAGTWSFTQAFIEGFSQCLAQKSHWDKESKGKDLVKDGEVLSQERIRTVDPKTIYIVGNKQRELPIESMQKDLLVKRDTFERFRRNNRNVEIITYDELYERAYFIVNGRPEVTS